jgi:WD40 repeat protein
MKMVLVFVAVLAAVFALWHYKSRQAAADAAQLARVMQLDPRKAGRSTQALLLIEAIPHLDGSAREAAVAQLRRALEEIPRRVVVIETPFPVETIRFSGDGRTALWYGKVGERLLIQQYAERKRDLSTWSSKASNVTFEDEAGTKTITDEESDAAGPRIVMSRDGGYLSVARDGVLAIWRLRDIAGGSKTAATFVGHVPFATTRLQCARSTEICGVESPGRLTLVDVKNGTVLRTIVADRKAVIRMSSSARLVGVFDARKGLTIHPARGGGEVQIGSAGRALFDFAFSADEKSIVALGSDGVLHSYDAATGKPGASSPVVRGEQWKSSARIDAVADGRWIVWDAQKVRLVSADLAKVNGRFDEGGEVVLLKTNGRGDRLAIARRQPAVSVWDVTPKPVLPLIEEELLDVACERIGRTLTDEEWETYGPKRDYKNPCFGRTASPRVRALWP